MIDFDQIPQSVQDEIEKLYGSIPEPPKPDFIYE